MPNWIRKKQVPEETPRAKEEVTITLFVEAPANELVGPLKEIVEGLSAQDIMLLQKLWRKPLLKAAALRELRKSV